MNKQEIKQAAKKMGADLVGIVSVEKFEKSVDKGFEPSRYLPGAQSLIALGLRMSPTIFRLRVNAWAAEEAYVDHSIISNLAVRVAQRIQRDHGYFAIAVPHIPRDVIRIPWIPIKQIAVEAGLGEVGMNDFVINPDYGPRVFYSAVLTTMPLDSDHKLRSNPCPHSECLVMWEEKMTTPCLSCCPSCLFGSLEQGRLEWRRHDWSKCLPRMKPYGYIRMAKTLEAAFEAKDKEERTALLCGPNGLRVWKSLAWGAETDFSCFECMRVCPVGRKSFQLN